MPRVSISGGTSLRGCRHQLVVLKGPKNVRFRPRKVGPSRYAELRANPLLLVSARSAVCGQYLALLGPPHRKTNAPAGIGRACAHRSRSCIAACHCRFGSSEKKLFCHKPSSLSIYSLRPPDCPPAYTFLILQRFYHRWTPCHPPILFFPALPPDFGRYVLTETS